jgi:hypothetical protein
MELSDIIAELRNEVARLREAADHHSCNYKFVVEQLREWLRQGATISAVDRFGSNVLAPDAKGSWFGGVTVSIDGAKRLNAFLLRQKLTLLWI